MLANNVQSGEKRDLKKGGRKENVWLRVGVLYPVLAP